MYLVTVLDLANSIYLLKYYFDTQHFSCQPPF
nr:MAG TPA: hypothetical protein [Caudoviricetes sp.]